MAMAGPGCGGRIAALLLLLLLLLPGALPDGALVFVALVSSPCPAWPPGSCHQR